MKQSYQSKLFNPYQQKFGKHLYIIQNISTKDIKIGRSNDPLFRLEQLQTANSNKLRLLISLTNQGLREKTLHKLLQKYNKNGEWFSEYALPELPIDIYEQLDLDIINS